MNVISKKWLCSVAFLWTCSSGNANQLSFFIAGGPNFSTLKNEQSVQIDSLITNAYKPKENSGWQGFAGVGAYHVFDQQWWPFFQLSLGVAGYDLHLGQVRGVEFPFINDGVYDTLNYKFAAKSRNALFESRFSYSRYSWQPFALVGIGCSWNRLVNYSDVPTDPSLSASPVVPGFSNHTQSAFSYELGIGIQHQLWDDSMHHMQAKGRVGYQYFNLGKGRLGGFPVQQSTDRLRINNLYTQGIVFALDVSFS